VGANGKAAGVADASCGGASMIIVLSTTTGVVDAGLGTASAGGVVDATIGGGNGACDVAFGRGGGLFTTTGNGRCEVAFGWGAAFCEGGEACDGTATGADEVRVGVTTHGIGDRIGEGEADKDNEGDDAKATGDKQRDEGDCAWGDEVCECDEWCPLSDMESKSERHLPSVTALGVFRFGGGGCIVCVVAALVPDFVGVTSIAEGIVC